MSENIVQLELSLVEFEGVRHILIEIVSRAKDNKRFKLVVRMFDIQGTLTRHVQMMQRLALRSDAFYRWLPADFCEWPRWKRLYVNWYRRRLSVKNSRANQRLVKLALQGLRDTIRHEGPIAVEEYPGAPWRLVRHNELHELLETAGRARSAWAFVFKPNELLADRNTLVARAF